MFENPFLQQLPKHLLSYVADQNYELYTSRDQAVWRYVMKRNHKYLSNVAHEAYVNGLATTGISLDHIPSLEEMNQCLSKIGWGAVAVDGFIPPSAFMEFQKYKVLVIAADIRPYNQIEYTPAPDIIHEAAGHAPIIADPDYAEYLRYFGEIGSRAFSSKNDYKVYEAIRHLSILKANPYSAAADIESAEQKIDELNLHGGFPSEMTLIRNLHWWTVEYGLIGSLNKPKIYGAGLLSSIGESKNALRYDVTKLLYSLDAQDYSFDITKPQPQLFVTPNFEHLISVLDEFANQMAYRTGGLDGLMKAIESGNTATVEYISGLQVSGNVNDVLISGGRPVYFSTQGPTTLNYLGKQIEGEGKAAHADGFGSPIGKIRGSLKPNRFLSDSDLTEFGIVKGKKCSFEFESGVKVEGVLNRVVRREGKIILMTFYDCKVTHNRKTLFEPSWGHYDMAVGESIKSVFSGPADPDNFDLSIEPPVEKTIKINYDANTKKIFNLYSKTEEITNQTNENEIYSIINEIEKLNKDEWLIFYCLLSKCEEAGINSDVKQEIISRMDRIKSEIPSLKTLISKGIELMT